MTTSRPLRDWRRSDALTWTRYDDSDQWVVFNPASAHIHLVTASTYQLWTLIGEPAGQSLETLAAALAVDSKTPVDDELLRVTTDTLAFMDRAGLVRLVDPVTSA